MILAAVALCLAVGPTHAQEFVTVDVPGALGTAVYGIDGNNIVGYYYDSTTSHGFLYDGTTFTTLDHPDQVFGTAAYGISGNTIVGTYYTGQQFGQVVFVYNHGFTYDTLSQAYTTLDDPLAQSAGATSANGVSGTTVVGDFFDDANVDHGFAYTAGVYTTLDDPLGVDTVALGIYGNTIVGYYFDGAGNYHGFSYNGTDYTTLDDPLGAQGTTAYAIQDSTVVGNYVDTDGNGHGYIFDGTNYVTVDEPQAYQPYGGTSLSGFSDGKAIGNFNDAAGVAHGFVASTPEPGVYALLATLGISSLGYARSRKSIFARLLKKA